MAGSLPRELFVSLWENFLTELSRILAAWTEVARLACFYQWMANTDRNHGNLVIDSNGAIAIIDHERVLFDVGFDESDAMASTDCPSQILLMINLEDRGRVLMAGAAEAKADAIPPRKTLEVLELADLHAIEFPSREAHSHLSSSDHPFKSAPHKNHLFENPAAGPAAHQPTVATFNTTGWTSP